MVLLLHTQQFQCSSQQVPDGSDFSEDLDKFSDVCAYDTAKAADYWAKGLEELGESEITLDMVVDADDAPQKVAQVLKSSGDSSSGTDRKPGC